MDFFVLGPLEVHVQGRPVALGGTKQRAVLALLLLRRNSFVHADALVDAVWQQSPPLRARAVLQVYMANVRKALEPARRRGEASSRITTASDRYRLRVEPGECDLDRFEDLTRSAGPGTAEARDPATRAAILTAAERLWRGPAFPDLASAALPELSRLEEDRLVTVENRVEAQLEAGGHAEALGELAALVGEHPLRERLRRLLVLALYRSGRGVEALTAHRAARRHWATEFGVDPSRSFQLLERAILRHDPSLDDLSLDHRGPEPPVQDPPGQRVPRPAAAATAGGTGDGTAEHGPGRLPPSLNALIGRQEEVLVVGDLLRRRGTRLVTLHGPGGSGKTRLALAVAARALTTGDFSGGVRFVPCAALTDPRLVLPAIADALEVSPTRGTALADELATRLSVEPSLLVLDNVEQVIEAAPAVAGLIAAAPAVTVLATSRRVLGVAGEHRHLVPPLPDADAVALFVERTRTASPGHVIGPEAMDDVAQICRRLDGLPLAIELAAARMRVLDTRGLLSRLDLRLRLLTGGPLSGPARHHTLRATLDWSHELLGAVEQVLFGRLSAFAGGATLEAVQDVCGAGTGDPLEVLDQLQALVESSLLEVDRRAGEPRFVMLQTVRDYAHERLRDAPDEDDVRRRHAACYLRLAERLEPDLVGRRQQQAIRRLDVEHDNLRRALAWAVAVGAHDTGVRLAGALGQFWERTSRFDEGRRALADVLAGGGATDPAARAKAHTGAGNLAFRQGDHRTATQHHREAHRLYLVVGDREGRALALNNISAGSFEDADYAAAEKLVRRSLGLTRDPRVAGQGLGNLAEIAVAHGDYPRAVALHERAVRRYTEARDDRGVLISRYGVAMAVLFAGDDAGALRHLSDGARAAEAVGDVGLATEFLHGAATANARLGRAAVAARLLGAVATLRRSTGAFVPSNDQAVHDAAARQARSVVGAGAFDAHWAAGQAWSLAEAVTATTEHRVLTTALVDRPTLPR